jgi:RNA polymerase sigma-70 factor (ECF subfamily)
MSHGNERVGGQGIDSVQTFIRLFNMYHHRIYGYCMSLTGNWANADDIFQETAVVLWEKFEKFEPGTDFLSWALKIAYFQFLSHRKKQAIHSKHFSTSTLENISEITTSSAKDSVSLESLRKCVEKLPDHSKELLSLRYEDRITIQKISDRVQQSVAVLYKRYQKIHSLLFECVRRQIRGVKL